MRLAADPFRHKLGWIGVTAVHMRPAASGRRVQGIVCRWWVVCGFWPSLPGPTAGAPRHPQRVFGVVDHIAPTDVNRSDASLSPSARSFITELRTRTAEACIAQGARLITDHWSDCAGLTQHGFNHVAIAKRGDPLVA